MEPTQENQAPGASNFIRQIIDEDNRTGKHSGKVATRFPPEPNGYLHIGHAKSICLNFGLARDYRGTCNLRFDDTNPTKEDIEYVNSIQDDIRWLGFQWSNLYYAADYFEQLLRARRSADPDGQGLCRRSDADQMREYRGTLTAPGRNSPYRDRSVEENLDLLKEMRAGEFPDGSKTSSGEDRHGVAQYQYARPGALSHPPRASSSHGRRLVHLSDVHLRPSARGYDRRNHALDLHARVRGPASVLRLAARHAQDALSSAADRVRRLNIDYTVMSKRKLLQLVEEEPRRRLGRSPHAHDPRDAATRIHARGDPRSLRPRRRHPEEQLHRIRDARNVRPRGS